MEIGCPRHPWIFTICSQLLDGDWAPIAGKSWQPSHEPSHRREKAGTCHTDKTIERKGRDSGGETTPEQSPHAWDSDAGGKHWQCETTWTPCGSRACDILVQDLASTTIKLHLTAFNQRFLIYLFSWYSTSGLPNLHKKADHDTRVSYHCRRTLHSLDRTTGK